MPKVISIVYKLDSGAKVEYKLDEPEEITEDSMSYIIRMADGEDLENIVIKYL